jgi:hypothetical protein
MKINLDSPTDPWWDILQNKHWWEKRMQKKRMSKGFMLVSFGATFAYLFHKAYQPLNEAVTATAKNEIERVIFSGVTPFSFILVGLVFGITLTKMKME